MNITVSQRPHASVVQMQGRFLGSLHGDAFRGTLDELKRQDRRNVVVDLSRVDFMDSSAIGALIGGLTTMRREGGDIRLAGLERRTRDLFLMTRLLGNVFADYPTPEEADRSYAAAAPVRPAS